MITGKAVKVIARLRDHREGCEGDCVIVCLTGSCLTGSCLTGSYKAIVCLYDNPSTRLRDYLEVGEGEEVAAVLRRCRLQRLSDVGGQQGEARLELLAVDETVTLLNMAGGKAKYGRRKSSRGQASRRVGAA